MNTRHSTAVILTAAGLIASWSPAGPAQAAPASTVNTVPYLTPDGKRGNVDLSTSGKPADIPGGPLVISLGDSYISGEAGRWAGNVIVQSDFWRTNALGATAYNDVPGAEAIKDCHRSAQAEVNFKGPGVTSVNLACSGATTGSSYNAKTDTWKPGIDFATQPLPGPTTGFGQAKMLQNLAAANPQQISMVVLSIGGNDFDFGTIVAKCAEAYMYGQPACSSDKAITDKVAEPNRTVQRQHITDAINRVITAVGDNGGKAWTLLVQDYPSPVATSKTIRYKKQTYERWYSGGCPMYNADLDWANETALKEIDKTVVEAVNEASVANPKARIRFLELQDALKGHRLCEQNVYPQDSADQPIMSWDLKGAVDTSEWVQSIRIAGVVTREWVIWPFRTQESLHPDYWAQLAYQNCLSQAYGDGTAVRGGACVYGGTGLDESKRPRMKLVSDSWSQPAPDVQGAYPGKVRDLQVASKSKKLVRVSWNPPVKANSRTGYSYRLKNPKTGWGPWMPLGVSRAVAVTMPRKGAYRIKVVAQSQDRTGKPTVASFRRG